MASVVGGAEKRRYVPDELLRLRDYVPADSGLLEKLKNHPDLGKTWQYQEVEVC